MNPSESGLDTIDLSHHLSDLARARGVSPLKGLEKYLGTPGLISLAGGLPNPAYFPFETIGGDVLAPDTFPAGSSQSSSPLTWLWNWLSPSEKTIQVSVPKYPAHPGDLNLASSLQYGTANGLPQLRTLLRNFVARVYQPGFSNFAVLPHAGNTDAWAQVITTLCNPGEGVLLDKWTYATVLAQMQPMGYKPVPIDIDFQGTRPDDLRSVLANWNESARGMPRPHVLYQVPVGQNPTGMTMSGRRKKEIYDICVEFDIIIVEDDPYYFLQEGPYVPKPQRAQAPVLTAEQYLATLTPTYLRFDYQGRVIRLDSFSKTVAPGSRLGWFTCYPLFAERMERQIEVSTQSPCGFSQSLIIALLNKWGYNGWIRWLQALGTQYKERRDFFVDCMHEEFSLQQSFTEKGIFHGSPVYLASAKQTSSDAPYQGEKSHDGYGKVLFSVTPPTSGMFVWMKVNFQGHPRFSTENVKSLELKLWTDLAEAGLLIAPGWMFNSTGIESPHEGHYRISFSAASHEDMRKALQIFGHVTRRFFQ